MIGGKIVEYFIYEADLDTGILTAMFLVKDHHDYCTVKAEIPKDAIEFNLVEEEQSIWWQSDQVFIKIEETQDIPFKKVGFSGGDKKSYFEMKNKYAYTP